MWKTDRKQRESVRINNWFKKIVFYFVFSLVSGFVFHDVLMNVFQGAKVWPLKLYLNISSIQSFIHITPNQPKKDQVAAKHFPSCFKSSASFSGEQMQQPARKKKLWLSWCCEITVARSYMCHNRFPWRPDWPQTTLLCSLKWAGHINGKT